MTQKEKQLLLKDLCARLPYGVKGLSLGSRVDTISTFVPDASPWVKTTTGLFCYLGSGQFKPYLRPMSSMTDEEEKIFNDYLDFQAEYASDADLDNKTDMYDWLNAHYFDYRGLIEKGLALKAPEGMYKED